MHSNNNTQNKNQISLGNQSDTEEDQLKVIIFCSDIYFFLFKRFKIKYQLSFLS
jgi:hypothetical protein